MSISRHDQPPVLQTVRPPDPAPAWTAAPAEPVTWITSPLAVAVPLMAVDIAAFGDPMRDGDAQAHLRRTLYEHLAESFALTQVPWQECYLEDRGDGAVIVAPAQVAPAYLLDPFAHHMTALLRRSNRLASRAGRLRLRVAVHTGRVRHDGRGLLGHDLIHLFRMLEAAAFKRALDACDADMGMIVSDPLYADTRARGGLFNPDAYRPLELRHKRTRTRGWLWLPPAFRPAG